MKVADKLTSLYKKEKESYERYWDDINVFIKYGCLRDEKFFEKVDSAMIYKNTDNKYVTLEEYLGGKESKDVYYVTDPEQQAQYINMFKEQGIDALILPSIMDTHFISFLEMKKPEIKFKRIDSALSENTTSETDEEKNKALIEKVKAQINDETLKIEVQELKNTELPAILLLSEQSRRMQEMYRSYGQQMAAMANMFQNEFTLVLNSSNKLVKRIEALDEEDANTVIDHIYDLARISHSPLTGEQMTKFIERSNAILNKLYK